MDAANSQPDDPAAPVPHPVPDPTPGAGSGATDPDAGPSRRGGSAPPWGLSRRLFLVLLSVAYGAAYFGIELVYQPLGLILPVGLSFVVFQTLSYTIDIYREELKARDSWLEVVLFISFFPQIVAGPIVRAADFLPQLDHDPELNEDDGARALFRIATGMFKKLVIADLLAANLVDRVFAQPETAAPELAPA